MATATEATQPAQPKRPSVTDGVCSEFTLFPKIKPGHEDALREELAKVNSDVATRRAVVKEIGTIHTARHVMFDNGTRYMFASVFDGTWDNYIDDFGATSIGAGFDRVFAHTEGYPSGGISDPKVKEWIVAQQEPALVFASAYPDLTVQQIWKDQRVNQAFQAVLDTPEFQAALDNPANAALRATPAFQKLLDEAAG
jgi:hypothetical protein